VDALRRAGALSPVTVAATHGLFVGDAPVALSIPSVGAILSTDTVPGQPVHWDRLRTVSIASLLAGALQRTLEHRSVRDLYQ
jgi:ribose-phosphate pyrophosphokinase